MAPLLDLMLGGSEYRPRTLILQAAAATLPVCGVMAHFTALSRKTTVVLTVVVTGAAAIVALNSLNMTLSRP